MLDVGTGNTASAAKGPLADWMGELSADDTFWVVGSSEAGLGPIPMPRAGGSESLPPLQSFAVSGRLDADVSVTARGQASDPEAANKIADVVRGLVALGSLQDPPRPELDAVLDSVQIGTFDNRIEVFFAVPYETFRRLASHRKTEAEE